MALVLIRLMKRPIFLLLCSCLVIEFAYASPQDIDCTAPDGSLLSCSKPNLAATDTDKQVDKLVEMLHSSDPKTVKLAIEFVQGSEYIENPRIQMAVLDHWDEYQFSALVLDTIGGAKLVQPDTIEHMFVKSLIGRSEGGYSDDGRQRAAALFEKWGSNDYVLFRRLLEKAVAVVSSHKYPNYPAEVSGFFFKTFKNLGAQASVLDQFSTLEKIFAKCDGKLHRDIATSVGSAFNPVQASEEQALFELFLKSDEKNGTTKENFAYWILNNAKSLRFETMVKLRDISLSGPLHLRDKALNLALMSINPSDPMHAKFLLDFLKDPEISATAKERLFFVLERFELDAASAREVYEIAMEFVFEGSKPEAAFSMVFKSWRFWNLADFRRILTLGGHPFLPSNIRHYGVRLKIEWLREVLPLLRSKNSNERSTAIAFLDIGLDAKFYDFQNAEQETLALMNFTREACALNSVDDVKEFCVTKIKEANDSLLTKLTRLPPSVSLKYLRDDAMKALRGGQEFIGDGSTGYWSLDFLRGIKRSPDLKWTTDDFNDSWVSFVTDQIESGDPELLESSRTFFIYMSSIKDDKFQNPLWNIGIGNNQRLQDLLKSQIAKGTPATAKAALTTMGMLLSKTSEPIELDRWYMGLLREGSPHVVSALLQNPWYIKSYEMADVDLIVSFAKGKNPELRGSSFNVLAYPYLKPQPMTPALEGLVPDAQTSLLSSEVAERSWAIRLCEIKDSGLRLKIFTPEVIEGYLAHLVASKDLFLQPYQPGSINRDYFLNSVSSFVKLGGLTCKLVTPENYPAEMMQDLIWAPDRKIAREAILGIGYYYAAVSEKLPSKRYGKIKGAKDEVVIPKDLLDQFAKLAAKETNNYLVYVVNLSVTKSRENFSIEKYIEGSLQIEWDHN